VVISSQAQINNGLGHPLSYDSWPREVTRACHDGPTKWRAGAAVTTSGHFTKWKSYKKDQETPVGYQPSLVHKKCWGSVSF
jgi:hypothetical protein